MLFSQYLEKLRKCFEAKKPQGKSIHGFLANQRLLQIASYDVTLFPAARRMLGIFLGYADQKGTCHKSINRVALEMNISPPAVHKQIDILIEHKYILEKVRRKDPLTGASNSNVYSFNQDLAKQFYKCPYVFNHYGRALLIIYLLTLTCDFC